MKPAVEVRRHRLTSAYVYSLAGVGLVALTGVVTGVLSSRTLGPIGRGELTALLLLPGLLGALANLGFSQAVGYLDSPVRNRPKPAAGAAIVAGLIAGLALYLCLLPILPLLLPNLSRDMLLPASICLVSVPLTCIYGAMRGAELAAGHFRSYNLLQVSVGIGQVLFMLIFWQAGRASAAMFGFAIILALVAVLLARGWAVKRMLFAGGVTWAAVTQVLRKAWEFTQPELAGLALLRCDVLVLARMVSNEQLGIYTAALALGFGQAFAANPLSQVCFHSTSSARDRSAAVELLARQFRFLQILFLALAVISIALAPVVLTVAFGSRFAGGAVTARILVVSMAVWSCSQVLEGGMRGLDLSRSCSLINLAGLAFLLVSSPWLVRALGIEGMALSMVFAQTLCLTAKLWVLRTRTHCALDRFWAFSRGGMEDVLATVRIKLESLLRNARRESLESVGSL